MQTIIRSKLSMPRLAGTTQRHRLYPLIHEIPSKKLVTIVAGAGYGKTTLAAQASHYLKTDTVWYRLDSSDRDFTTFIHYLIAGIQEYYPQTGEKTRARIEQTMFIQREHRTILRVFLREVEESIIGDMIIVLDDYHSIASSEEIRECLHFLLENMPAKLHVVLISRRDPGLSLSRLRAARDVLDIREDDLAFTTPEIEELYCRVFATRLKQASLDILHTKTGGWAAGLILLFHYSRGKSPEDIEGFLLKLKGSHRFITNYLEENVYEMLPVHLKSFLCKTSILSRLNADFCDKLLGIKNSGQILRNLEEDHLFTFPFDEERHWYYYHHLFQEFLLTRLGDLDQKTVSDLHKQAAIIWEDLGEEEEALKHYIEASEHVTACKLLGRMGRRKLLKEGRLKMTDAFIRKIPEDLLKEEPWIRYIQARVFELSGRPFDAVRTYKEAYTIFERKGPAKYADLCIKGLGYNYFVIGDFQGAETILKEVLEKARDNPRFCFDILGLLILISSHLGRMTDADQYYREAMSILPSLNDPSLAVWIDFNLAFRYGCSGDYEKAAELGQKVKETFLRLDFSLYLSMTYHLMSWINYYLGRFQSGLDHAEEGLKLAEEKGINDTTYGWLLMDYAMNALGLERYDDAINAAGEALQNFQHFECRWGQSYISHVFQLIYAELCDYSTAERFALSGLEAIEELDLPLDKGFMKSSLGAMFLETGRFDEARELLEEAVSLLRPTKLFRCQAYLWLARYYQETGRPHDAVEYLALGLNLGKQGHYEHWIVREKNWIIPSLVMAFARQEMQGYIRMIIRAIGSYARDELIRLSGKGDHSIRNNANDLLNEIREIPPEGLRIQCLGKFAVCKGNKEITQERWTSRKAMMLFKILIHERAKGFIPKDILMEKLWPEQNPAKILNRFHVTLSMLRKTLEPDLPKARTSSYLIRNGDAYRLDLGKDSRVDADVFKEHVTLARQIADNEESIAHCLEAERLYQGDFLQEDLYDDWCAYERELLQQEYIYVLKQLIGHFEEKADFEQCILYARKYLVIDSYDEGIYQDLMRYYSLIGNKGMVVRTYEKCRENLFKGMDAAPSPETETLYRKLK